MSEGLTRQRKKFPRKRFRFPQPDHWWWSTWVHQSHPEIQSKCLSGKLKVKTPRLDVFFITQTEYFTIPLKLFCTDTGQNGCSLIYDVAKTCNNLDFRK